MATSSDHPCRYALALTCSLVVAAFVLLQAMNAQYPLIGHDHSYFIPRLLYGVIAFRSTGIEIPYYSPHFCGAQPFYGNPQSMFYSVPQVLTLLLDPWLAIQLTSALFLIIGGLGGYLIARQILGLSPIAALSAAIPFAANGFFRERMVIGHLSYHSFMLLPLLTVLLLSKRLSHTIAIAGAGLCAAYFVHSGTHVVTLITFLSLILALIVAYTRRESEVVGIIPLLARAGIALALGAALSASKLVAVFSYLENHPRPGHFDSDSSLSTGLTNAALQLFWPAQTPTFHGAWEYDASVPLAVMIGLLVFGVTSITRKYRPEVRELLGGVIFIILSAFTLAIAIGYAPVIDQLRPLPFFDSLRLNLRFTAALIFPLVLISALGVERLPSIYKKVAVLLVVLSALYHLTKSSGAGTEYDSSTTKAIYGALKSTPLSELSVQAVRVRPGADIVALRDRVSLAPCYEALFNGSPPVTSLREGPIISIFGGTFNLTNPACSIYPRENSCHPGDLIREDDRPNLERLVSFDRPNWGISDNQNAANMISIVTLLGVGVMILFHRLIRRRVTTL